MARYAIVSLDGIVDVAEWDGESDWAPPAGELVLLDQASPVGPGWTYDGNEFVAPKVAVPGVVSAAQLKLALLGAGRLDNANAFAASQPREAQIRWEYSTEYRRDHPTLNAMAGAFGLTAAEVDDLFRQAATL